MAARVADEAYPYPIRGFLMLSEAFPGPFLILC